jgi:hypothetical protein
MHTKPSQEGYPNFYELAVLLADAQSRDSESHWEDFIDNLSRICDQFACQIAAKDKPLNALSESGQRHSHQI